MADPVPTLPPTQWLRPQDHAAILSHTMWGLDTHAKTGIQVCRSSPAAVTGVVQPPHAGQDLAPTIGVTHRGPIPAYADLGTLLADHPETTRVLVGEAPPGGRLPDEMRADIRLALERGLPVLCGLHTFLAEDPEFAALALEHQAPIVDLRRPLEQGRITDGVGARIPVPVVLTIGTDCRSGKQTTSVALREAAARRGLDAAFVATGQTGLLLSPAAGAPIDRLIIDFAAGEVERQVLRAARLDDDLAPTDATPDLIVVEGQGCLSHPAYSPVSLALLHGAWPDALIVCHRAGRKHKTVPTHDASWPVYSPRMEAELAERMLLFTTGATTCAIALSTPELDDEAFEATRVGTEADEGLPAFDVVREGADGLLDVLVRHLSQETARHGKRLDRLHLRSTPSSSRPSSTAPR